MDHQEILKQRDLLDAMLASRTNQYEKIECMKVMDSRYFKKQLPENVVLFPLQMALYMIRAHRFIADRTAAL